MGTEYGLDFVFFHCTEDNRHIRRRVFGILQDHLAGLRIDTLIAEKSRINAEEKQSPEAFYPQMLGHLLRHVAGQNELEGIGELIVITDSIPVNKKRAAVEKAVKNILLPGCRFRVLHIPPCQTLACKRRTTAGRCSENGRAGTKCRLSLVTKTASCRIAKA
jgi:hypothetical protein